MRRISISSISEARVDAVLNSTVRRERSNQGNHAEATPLPTPPKEMGKSTRKKQNVEKSGASLPKSAAIR
jgi:hypothetical protein